MPTLPYLTDTSTQLSGTYTTSAAALDNYATSNYVNSFWTTSPTNNYLVYLNRPFGATNGGKVGIGITLPTGVLEMSNSIDPYNLITGARVRFGSKTANTAQAVNSLFSTDEFRIISADAAFNLFTVAYVSNYDDPTPRTYVFFISRTALSMVGDGSFSGNLAVGTTPGTYKCNINGSLNSTSFYQNGTLIDFSSYATNTNLTNNYYNKASTDTLLNAKQPNLTAATTLLGTGGSITGINYNTVINKLTFQSPLSSNATTNLISIDLSSYATNASLTTAQTNNSNYTRDASNVLQTNINTTNTNLTATNTNITNNYYNKASTDTLLNAKEQILIFSSPLTRLTNTIGINLSAYSTSGTDTAYVLKSGSTMTGNLTTGTILTIGGGLVASTLHLTDISTAGWKLQTGGFNLTFTNDSSGTFATKMTLTNAGNLTTIGTITGTTFSGSGASLTNVPYAALTGTVPFYTKSEADTLLNAKEQILTFSSPLIRTTNTISINLGSYSTSGTDPAYVLKTGSTMTGLLTGTTINATTALQEAGTNLSSKYLALAGGTLTGTLNGTTINASTNLQEAGTNLSSKYLALAGGTLTGTLNGTTINASTNLQEAGTNLSSKYLALAGGTLTGNLTGTNITGTKVSSADATGVNAACLGRQLNVVGTNAVMRIWRDSTTNAATMEFMSGPMTSGTSYTKLWDMGCGGTTDTNYFFIRDRKPPTTAEFRLFINDAGNTGMGTTSPVSKLDVRGTIYSQTSVIADITNIGATNNYQLRLSPPSTATQYAIIQSIYQSASIVYTPLILQASGGNVGIGNEIPLGTLSIGRPDFTTSDGTLVISKNGGGNRNFKFGYDASFNFCMGDFGGATSGNTWNSSQFNINWNTGNVGIGAINQSPKLYVNGTTYLNGATTVNSSLAVNGDLTVQDGYSIRFGSGGTDGRIYRTGGQVYIEADDLIYFKSTFGGANGYFNQGTLYMPSTITTDAAVVSPVYICNGETYAYNSNWNSTTQSGWFVGLNRFWGSGHAYVNLVIYLIGGGGTNAYCWFGRLFLSIAGNGTSPAPNGGIISVNTDYRNPSSGNYTINVVSLFDANGNNVAWITVQGGVFAGNIKVKMYG
jgi:hypothetical protein